MIHTCRSTSLCGFWVPLVSSLRGYSPLFSSCTRRTSQSSHSGTDCKSYWQAIVRTSGSYLSLWRRKDQSPFELSRSKTQYSDGASKSSRSFRSSTVACHCQTFRLRSCRLARFICPGHRQRFPESCSLTLLNNP